MCEKFCIFALQRALEALEALEAFLFYKSSVWLGNVLKGERMTND